ncbi:MAG: rod shape-determining protein MreD [Nitrococcus mobilis]|nr:rod shape-determining protein MreD [Nitrococcus mobilis]
MILLSLLAGLVLTVLPLPMWARPLRPEWTALILIYWCMALPQRVGVTVAWTVGLLQDVLQGFLLGAHALAFGVVAFLTLKLHQRIRVFPLWQQALSTLLLLLVIRLILLWVRGLSGQPGADWQYWLPALTGTALWPPLFLGLRAVRRRFQVQ